MPRRLLSILAVWLLVVEGGFAGGCWAGPFTAGDLVVVRVGDGGSSLQSSTTQVFLDEYNPTTGALVQSLGMPTSVSGANRAFTLSGLEKTEGYLNRSVDGRYLTLAGYDAGTGASAAGSIPSAFQETNFTDRVVARVDVNGAIDTTTVLTNAYSGDSIRSAATVDGSRFWVSGTSRVSNPGANTGGVYLIDHGATTGTQLSTTLNDTRNIAIINGQLFVSSIATGAVGVNKVGTGVPTTPGQPITSFVDTTSGPGTTPLSFVVFDLDNNGVPDRVYVADDRTNGSGGLQKWTSTDGTNWTLVATFGGTGVRGLTGGVINGNPVLYATTSPSATSAGNALVSFTDDGNNTAFATIAIAADNTTFRGVAFAPAVAEPGTIALAGLGGLALFLVALRRRTKGLAR